jgi:gluconate 2-dehydrogenase gamma chain
VRRFSRRDLLATGASALAGLAIRGITTAGMAATIKGAMPMSPDREFPPTTPTIGNWHFFTDSEGAAIEALVDRLIPADANSPGGKDIGCAVYIDRQLAGPYGNSANLYMSGPFQSGTKQQGPQTPVTPSKAFRQALAALDRYCRQQFGGQAFVQLQDGQKDQILQGLEDDKIKLEGADGKDFFETLLKNTQEGFFADPIYGGNKDMAAWKMIGFPGARYDYRDWVSRHNQTFPLAPVGIAEHPDWSH